MFPASPDISKGGEKKETGREIPKEKSRRSSTFVYPMCTCAGPSTSSHQCHQPSNILPRDEWSKSPKDAQGTPTQSRISPSILVYEERRARLRKLAQGTCLPGIEINASREMKQSRCKPLSREYGTFKTVKARCWPWLRPNSGLGFQVKVVNFFKLFPRRERGTPGCSARPRRTTLYPPIPCRAGARNLS